MYGKKARAAKIFRTVLYIFTGFLLAYSAYLFLSNFDQLIPARTAEKASQEMTRWSEDREFLHRFAGGFWQDPYFWRSLNITVIVTLITTFIAFLLGIPAAYALSRYKIPGKGFIESVCSSIIVIPTSSVGICLIVMFNYGPLFNLQKALGFRVVHSIFPGMVIASLVVSLMLGITAWKATFDSINPRFEYVARSLGSSRWQAFRKVTFPLSKSGMAAGIILVWTRAMAEFGSVLLFCGTFKELPLSRFSPLLRTLNMHQADWLSVAVWSEIEYGNVEYGFALAFILVLIGGVSVYIMHRLGAKGYVWS